MQALHTRVKRSKAVASKPSQPDDFYLKIAHPQHPSTTSAPLPYLSEQEASGFSTRGHTAPIFAQASRPGSGSRSASRSGSRGSNYSRPTSRSGLSGEGLEDESGEVMGPFGGISLSAGAGGSRLDGPDGTSHGTIFSEDWLPGIPEKSDTGGMRHGVPGAGDDASALDVSGLAPCSSSEVWLSTSEDLEDMSSGMSALSAFSSEGKSPHASGDGGDPTQDADSSAAQRGRQALPTGLLPTVAEEPGGEDVTSPSVSQDSSSEDRVFSAPRSVSLMSTPQGFGSTLTGSMHSGTSPLQSFPTGSIGDAAPTSMDSSDLQHLSPKDSNKTADLNVFPSEALEEVTATVLGNTSKSPRSDATYVSCKSSHLQKVVSAGSTAVSGDESSPPPQRGLLTVACEDLEPPAVYASNDEQSSMSSVTAEPLEARAQGSGRSVAAGATGSGVPLPPDMSTSVNWLYNHSSTTSASTNRDSVCDSVTSAMLMGSINKVKGDKAHIPALDLSPGSSALSGGSPPNTRAPEAQSQQQPQHKACLLYTSPSPRDRQKSRMPSSA